MIKKAYVDTAGGQIHYRYCSEGTGSPLVFFHMTAASSEAYEGIMSVLDGKLPMIAFDTVNYGESFRTTREPSIDYIADVMSEALTKLGIDKFHSFGHHTGVSIAVEIAGKTPDRVLSVIMNGPTYATHEEMAYLMRKLALPNPISIKGTQFVWAWSRIKDNFPFSLWGDNELQAAIMHRDTVDMLRAGTNWHWGYRAVFSHDLPAAVKKVRCPMFLVCGQHDLSFPYHERMAADYPEVPSYVFADGGVYYIETHPEDLAPHLVDFIRGVQQGLNHGERV